MNSFLKIKKSLRKEALNLYAEYKLGLVEKESFEIRIREILKAEILAYLESKN